MSHRQVTNILFFNHSVIFLINYKSIIFLCFIKSDFVFLLRFGTSLSLSNLGVSFLLNFCTNLLRMLRIECPQKSNKTFFEIQILDQTISWAKFLAGHSFSQLPKIQSLLSEFVLSDRVQKKRDKCTNVRRDNDGRTTIHWS